VTTIIGVEQALMAKKKDRAFFICPRWNEVVEILRTGAPGRVTTIRVNEKILATIKGGRPVARSTLRKALLALRQASGSMFDVDAYIVDQRTEHS
jgi:ribosomal protein S28E/S33